MKRPASQYYWGDWRRDTALQSCSIAARGLWHEINCLMHDCEPYGHLMVGAAPMTSAQLARLVGVAAKEAATLLAELDAAGIFSRREDGAIYSRRMVRDESLRERRAAGGITGAEHGHKGGAHGAKGGRPRKPPDEAEGAEITPLPPPDKPPPAFASAFAFASEEVKHGATESVSRALGEPETLGQDPAIEPSVAGTICRAMRMASQGRVACNPGDLRLEALIAQGVTVAECEDAARDAGEKGKGWAWTLATIIGKRADAAAIRLAPPVDTGPTADEIRARDRAKAEQLEREEAERKSPERIAAVEAARQAAMEKFRTVTKGMTRRGPPQ